MKKHKIFILLFFIILLYTTIIGNVNAGNLLNNGLEDKNKICKFVEVKKVEESYSLDYNVRNKEYVVDGIYYGKQSIKNNDYSDIGIFGDGYYLKRKENGKEIFELSDGYSILGDEIEFYISNDKNNFILWKRKGNTIDIIKNKKKLYSINGYSFNKKNSIEIGIGGNTIDVIDEKGDIINHNLYGFNTENKRYNM